MSQTSCVKKRRIEFVSIVRTDTCTRTLIHIIMKNLYYALLASLSLASLSCQPVKGPVVLNRSGFETAFLATFSDGHEIRGNVKNGTVCWLGYDTSPLSEFRVYRNDLQILAVAESVLAQWQEHLGKDKLLIMVVEHSQVERITRDELRRLCRKGAKP